MFMFQFKNPFFLTWINWIVTADYMTRWHKMTQNQVAKMTQNDAKWHQNLAWRNKLKIKGKSMTFCYIQEFIFSHLNKLDCQGWFANPTTPHNYHPVGGGYRASTIIHITHFCFTLYFLKYSNCQFVVFQFFGGSIGNQSMDDLSCKTLHWTWWRLFI